MEYFTFGAEQEDVGTRIDVFLADAMENLSRSGVQKLIEEGHITLNGGRTKANYKLRERDIRFRVLLHSFLVHVPHPA